MNMKLCEAAVTRWGWEWGWLRGTISCHCSRSQLFFPLMNSKLCSIISMRDSIRGLMGVGTKKLSHTTWSHDSWLPLKLSVFPSLSVHRQPTNDDDYYERHTQKRKKIINKNSNLSTRAGEACLVISYHRRATNSFTYTTSHPTPRKFFSFSLSSLNWIQWKFVPLSCGSENSLQIDENKEVNILLKWEIENYDERRLELRRSRNQNFVFAIIFIVLVRSVIKPKNNKLPSANISWRIYQVGKKNKGKASRQRIFIKLRKFITDFLVRV